MYCSLHILLTFFKSLPGYIYRVWRSFRPLALSPPMCFISYTLLFWSDQRAVKILWSWNPALWQEWITFLNLGKFYFSKICIAGCGTAFYLGTLCWSCIKYHFKLSSYQFFFLLSLLLLFFWDFLHSTKAQFLEV